MTVKEKVVNQSIERITKRLLKIDEIIESDPLGRIIKIRQEAQKLLEDNQGIEKRTSKEFIDKIDKLAKEEKKQFKLAKKQTETENCLFEEKCKISSELSELRTELYYINNR